jgi:hypothetical protein
MGSDTVPCAHATAKYQLGSVRIIRSRTCFSPRPPQPSPSVLVCQYKLYYSLLALFQLDLLAVQIVHD